MRAARMSDEPPQEHAEPIGSPMFQMTIDDLEYLERTLPQLMWSTAFSGSWNNTQRIQWSKVQAVLSRVRWNGGPPLEVERIDP